MSGHSKWSTIKHQKGTKDIVRGKLFSKLSRAISVAIKTGGGSNPDTNSKLRVAIDAARAANMPKVNIERAVSKGGRGGEGLEEFVYEGFGPGGTAVMVEVATDNRNRAGQEIRGIFEKSGGRLAGPGAVSFNFERKGLVLLKKEKDVDQQMLRLIDLGVEEMEEAVDTIEIYVGPTQLLAIRKKIEDSGFSVLASEQVEKPKNFVTVTDVKKAEKILSFLNSLNEHEDVQKVFANVNIPNDIVKQIKTQ